MEEREEKIISLNEEINALITEQDRLVTKVEKYVKQLELITIILEHKSAELQSVF